MNAEISDVERNELTNILIKFCSSDRIEALLYVIHLKKNCISD